MVKKLGDILRWLSLGSYKTKLYFGNENESFSTKTGGILTLISVLYVIAASIKITYQTIFWENYSTTTTYSDLHTIHSTLKIGNLPLLQDFSFQIP